MPPPGPIPEVHGVDQVWALAGHGGSARELITAIKYRNQRGALRWLGRELAELVAGPCDVVTWVPACPTHRRSRGYDQGRLLARAVGRELGVPCRRVLRRRRGSAQTDRGRTARRIGPDLVAVRPAPRRVLVVDDVVTTGSSLRVAAAVCRAAGSTRVWALVATVAPSPS